MVKASNRTLLAVVAGWAVLVAGGLQALAGYSFRPTPRAPPPPQWPADTALARAPGLPTLVLVAHPRCGCTRATISELARLMSHVEGKLETYVIFSIPDDAPASWRDTDTIRSARRIPGVKVVLSDSEAKRFHGQVSGEGFLFDPAGNLVFSGGITPSRGHEGDNPGKTAILSFVLDGRARTRDMPAFGCALDDPNPRG